jgi:hypothetical protein
MYVCDLLVPFSGLQNLRIGQLGRKYTLETHEARCSTQGLTKLLEPTAGRCEIHV